MQSLRDDIRHGLFFHAVEAAAVDHPDIFFGFSVRIRGRTNEFAFKFRESAVKPCEIISCANPKDASKNMGPTENEVNKLLKIAQKNMNMDPAKKGIERHEVKI